MHARREFLAGISGTTLGFLCLPDPSPWDVGGAEAAAKRSRVIAACRKQWSDHKGDCSAFVRAVAQDLGIGLTGDANAIYTQIAKSPWVKIGVGSKASAVAGITAGEGKFVVGGDEGEKNGHVAVVVDYRNAFDSYSEVDRNKAVAFWGMLNSVGKEYTRITYSWKAKDLERVLFAYQVIR
jgi:hypothetical protein